VAELEAAASRLRLVAEVTTVLASTLSETEALRRLARLVVPVLGDWAAVDLLHDDQRVERIAVAHRDRSRAQLAALEGPLPPLPETARGVLARVLSGAPTLVLGAAELTEPPGDPLTASHQLLLEAMKARAAIVAPLTARGQIYGALTLGRSESAGRYGDQDKRVVIDDIARRAGLVVANARLFAAHQRTAEAMQRSLLAPLPQPGHLQLRARYLPAGQASRVGGDWYDAFLLPDGVTALVIGDVVGHDLQAAARMAQLRNMLRALAWNRQEPPSAILAYLDEAMEGVSDAELATAVLARIEGPESGPWQLSYSNAGHPQPLLVTRDGDTRYLDQPGLLLGLPHLGVTRTSATQPLPPASTLLLYTDGLIETRTDSLTDRLTSLRRHAAYLAHQPLDEFCDQLIERLDPSGDDDIALLAVRLPH